MYSCTHFKIFISFSVLSAASHANEHRKMTLNLSWNIAMATANITIWHLFVVVIVVAVVHFDFGIQCVSLCSFDCMLCNISLINCILIHSQLYDTIFMEKHCILAQLRALFDMHSLLLWRISYIIFSEHTQTQKLTLFSIPSLSLSHTFFLYSFTFTSICILNNNVFLQICSLATHEYFAFLIYFHSNSICPNAVFWKIIELCVCLVSFFDENTRTDSQYKAFYLCNIKTEISLFYKIIGGY